MCFLFAIFQHTFKAVFLYAVLLYTHACTVTNTRLKLYFYMQLLFLLAQTVTDFADAFQIGIIHCHHCIVWNFQFRKFLPAKSNRKVPQESSTFVE